MNLGHAFNKCIVNQAAALEWIRLGKVATGNIPRTESEMLRRGEGYNYTDSTEAILPQVTSCVA